MSTDRLQYLLDRLFQGRITEDEKEELAFWIDTLPDDSQWEQRLSRIWNDFDASAGTEEKMEPSRAEAMFKKILSEERALRPLAGTGALPYKPLGRGLMRWAVAAAAVVGILIVLSLVFLVPGPVQKQPVAANPAPLQKQVIKPGSNKATLTLANGEKILLDSIDNGALASRDGGKVIKLSNGVLKYQEPAADDGQQAAQAITRYNTISTPRGGQYQVILPDGSKVWLNAASSLKFPVTFGQKREITVTGEIYAEVAGNENKPFVAHILSPSGQDKGAVKVLGTRFNVNAYDIAVSTTLLEGAVKMELPSAAGGKEVSLRPGEQALITDGRIRINKQADLQEIIAWKNGLFNFEGNSIEEVMQQIARWYDIDVRYEGIPSVHFMGTISRNADISEVLKMLEMTGAVSFRIEGTTVTVKN